MPNAFQESSEFLRPMSMTLVGFPAGGSPGGIFCFHPSENDEEGCIPIRPKKRPGKRVGSVEIVEFDARPEIFIKWYADMGQENVFASAIQAIGSNTKFLHVHSQVPLPTRMGVDAFSNFPIRWKIRSFLICLKKGMIFLNVQASFLGSECHELLPSMHGDRLPIALEPRVGRLWDQFSRTRFCFPNDAAQNVFFCLSQFGAFIDGSGKFSLGLCLFPITPAT